MGYLFEEKKKVDPIYVVLRIVEKKMGEIKWQK